MSQLGESIDGRKRKQLRKLRLLMGAFEVGTMKNKIRMEEVAAMAVGQAMEGASMEAANMGVGAGEAGVGLRWQAYRAREWHKYRGKEQEGESRGCGKYILYSICQWFRIFVPNGF